MTRSTILVMLALLLSLLALVAALVLDAGLRQPTLAFGRFAFASIVVLGPMVAVGAFVGRIAEGGSVRTE